MKILSLNVNNFGGTNDKPLLKDYKFCNGKFDFATWNQAVDEWRISNKICIEKNVEKITNLAKEYDIVFFHEVDTNCLSWNELLKKMEQNYIWKPANGIEKAEYKKGRKRISCVFIKDSINFEYKKYNLLKKQRNIEIKVGDTYIIGLHMSYDIDDWENLISRFETLQNEELLIIGDLNVFDEGTNRREKFDELINTGAIDIWLKQGKCNDTPTANTKKRIDYALSTCSLYEKGIYEEILDYVRSEQWTDHAAIAITYNA